jgi:hypothetical protein
MMVTGQESIFEAEAPFHFDENVAEELSSIDQQLDTMRGTKVGGRF